MIFVVVSSIVSKILMWNCQFSIVGNTSRKILLGCSHAYNAK